MLLWLAKQTNIDITNKTNIKDVHEKSKVILIIGTIIAKPFHMKKGCQELSCPFSCIMFKEDNTLYLRLDHNVNLYKGKRIGDQ